MCVCVCVCVRVWAEGWVGYIHMIKELTAIADTCQKVIKTACIKKEQQYIRKCTYSITDVVHSLCLAAQS